MPKLNYPLKKYSKAVEKIAKENGLAEVKSFPTKGSIVRFELFEVGESIPMCFWVIHHGHDRKKEIWSKDDYRKAADRLNCSLDEFVKRVKDV